MILHWLFFSSRIKYPSFLMFSKVHPYMYHKIKFLFWQVETFWTTVIEIKTTTSELHFNFASSCLDKIFVINLKHLWINFFVSLCVYALLQKLYIEYNILNYINQLYLTLLFSCIILYLYYFKETVECKYFTTKLQL